MAWGLPFGFVENDHETAILLASSLGLIALGVLAGLPRRRRRRPWRRRSNRASGPAGELSESRPDVVPVRYRRCYRLLAAATAGSQLELQIPERRLALPPLSRPIADTTGRTGRSFISASASRHYRYYAPAAQILPPAPRLGACRLVLRPLAQPIAPRTTPTSPTTARAGSAGRPIAADALGGAFSNCAAFSGFDGMPESWPIHRNVNRS